MILFLKNSNLSDHVRHDRPTNAWMRSSRLRLNAKKTQLIWLGTRQQLEKLPTGDIQLLSASVRSQSVVRDLG